MRLTWAGSWRLWASWAINDPDLGWSVDQVCHHWIQPSHPDQSLRAPRGSRSTAPWRVGREVWAWKKFAWSWLLCFCWRQIIKWRNEESTTGWVELLWSNYCILEVETLQHTGTLFLDRVFPVLSSFRFDFSLSIRIRWWSIPSTLKLSAQTLSNFIAS